MHSNPYRGRSVRLKAIGLVMLGLASAMLWLTTANDLAGGLDRAWGHMFQAALLTALTVASLRWTAAVGRLLSVVGAVAVVAYPLIQHGWRHIAIDAVMMVEAIIVVPTFLGAVSLWLSARLRAREES
jgi:hypothetical protein